MKNSDWARRELLARHPLFSALPPLRLDQLVGACRLLELPAHRLLFRAGEPVREAHLVVSGTLKRSTILAGEARRVIELVQPGQVAALGELFAASDYLSSAESVGHCHVAAIDLRRLRALMREDAELGWRFVQAMGQRQCAIEFDVTGFHFGFTGTQRILNYLVELAGGRPPLAGETTVILPTSKKDVASRVGMTPETFSRSLRLLSEAGVIVVDGRRVHIQNAALQGAAIDDAHPEAGFARPTGTAQRPGRSLPAAVLVNLCGRLRMLSQRMATAWALIGRELLTSRARVTLRKADAEFTRVLVRLGGAALAAPLADGLRAVDAAWRRYRAALAELEPAAVNADTILGLSEEVLELADRLARRAEQAAGAPGASRVNVAGRNRMLSQRIGKLFVFRDWGVADAAVAPLLEASRAEFERNFAELRQALELAPEVAAQLDEVAAHWASFLQAMQPDLQLAGTGAQVTRVLTAGERLLRHVDTAVKLYERRAGD